MRTTVDLPEDLARAVKLRAAEENRTLKDVLADLLRRGLAGDRGSSIRRRVRLPLVECAHEASPDKEMTPERVAQVLLDEEAALSRDPLR